MRKFFALLIAGALAFTAFGCHHHHHHDHHHGNPPVVNRPAPPRPAPPPRPVPPPQQRPAPRPGQPAPVIVVPQPHR